MLEIPKLNVIIENKDLPKTKTFYNLIKEKAILKPQIKLMHISSFDTDLKTLHQKGLDLTTFSLCDFHLTESYELIVPIKSRIIPLSDNSRSKLKSYLIYFSYLYNINFLEIYCLNPNYLYKLIFQLNISEEIKQNLFLLLNNKEAPYFNETIEKLNNADYRENLRKDNISLVRKPI